MMPLKSILLSLLILTFVGCQPSSQRDLVDYSQIAGTWKAEKVAWQVTISNEGKVVSAIHPLGTAVIKPNETTYLEMKDGSKSHFKSGDFTLIYEPEKKQLEVSLDVEDIFIKYFDNEIKGNTKTVIGGFLSEDMKTWDADLVEVFDYGPLLPQAAVVPVPTKFYKISE